MPPEPIERTASNAEGGLMAGISLGGLIVILGILIAIFWSLWIGIIIALIGLLAFGGFARGRWY
jgi:hypothetical protein